MPEDKEMSHVDSERERLVTATDSEGPQSSTNMKLRYMNLSGLLLAFVLVGIVAYYAFRNGASLFSYHPVTMTLGWLVMMPAAINALRRGDLATSWIPAKLPSTRHWILQAIAATLIATGFLVILVNKINLDKQHFTTVHGIFGLFSVIFILVTLTGGIAALYSLKLKEKISPACTKIIHGIAGIITFTMGIVTIILGIFSHVIENESAQWLLAVIAIVVGLLTVLRPAIGLMTRLKEKYSR